MESNDQIKRNNAPKSQLINFQGIYCAIKKRWRTYVYVLPAVWVFAWIYGAGKPDVYNCTIQLAPETSGTNFSSLAALASSFGMNIGGGGEEGDAITPSIYPDLMNSVDFKTSLFKVMVQRKEDKTPMTYYDYLLNEQKQPWWDDLMDNLDELIFGESEKDNRPVDPFELTPQQNAIANMIKSKVVCSISKKSGLIMISVTDQDRYVAAMMADSVKTRLQDFLTGYKTQKARHDLEFTEKLYKESKRNYEHARQLYADFMDSNHDIVLENVRQKQTDLENEMQLRYNHYNAISAQLLAARTKVQEYTPSFTPIQSATVPLVKAGPARKLIRIAFVFLAFIITTIWILYKEGELKSLFGIQ